MRIAQIAPLAESCPPKLYGGTERIVSCLTEELVRQGHDVTLFASGDSHTTAKLVRCCRTALRLNPVIQDTLPYHLVMLEEVVRRADEFDVLHFHTDYLHFPLIRDFADRTITTLHGRLDLPDMKPLFVTFPEVPLVSISRYQRRPVPRRVNWAGNVYHGLPRHSLTFTPRPADNYLAFLGRISPEKRPDLAIEIATRAGMNLKIAAKVDKSDRAYWNDVIAPMIKACPNVEYVGEISDEEKASFLGNARALLFPIDWPEPFGIVMVEAFACGTPVIGFPRGSVPEIIDHSVTGFIVESVDEAIDAVGRLDALDRYGVRTVFEKRFTVERMTQDYVAIYRALPGLRIERLQIRKPHPIQMGLQAGA